MDSLILHPLFEGFLEKFNKVDPDKSTPNEMREALWNSFPPQDGKTDELFKFVQEEEHFTRDGVSMLITRPRNAPADQILPVILFLHGGGWVTGNAEDYKRARTEVRITINT
ncbi:hypothetical protein BJV82DRAFT_612484 [Fennellomyces sp. T-0311]|nr:hypothetical protein BJV82DRAFT_612484 [Fennellomyces sp. T-0311]